MLFNSSRALCWAQNIIVALAFGTIASAALAHAHVQKSTPAAGSTVTAPPTEIRLKFSEGVEPRFSAIALTGEAGASEATGKPTVDPADNSVLVATIPGSLKPGIYTVNWRAVSVDTHKTQGSFSFTVSP
jgi:methionine-rich copper-binding protein CopC